jgi:hypothetical protein
MTGTEEVVGRRLLWAAYRRTGAAETVDVHIVRTRTADGAECESIVGARWEQGRRRKTAREEFVSQAEARAWFERQIRDGVWGVHEAPREVEL